LDALLAGDRALLKWLLALPHPQTLNWVFHVASAAGIGGSLYLVVAAALLAAGQIDWKDAARIVIAIALVHAVVDLALKPWVARVRPPVAVADIRPFMEPPDSASFPSGHAANAVGGAIVVSRVWRRWQPLVWVVSGLVAVARVYLGVHYPLDALAGAVVGAVSAWLALIVPLPRRT
jgi:undecaprenyl-diphosphatase